MWDYHVTEVVYESLLTVSTAGRTLDEILDYLKLYSHGRTGWDWRLVEA